MALHDQFNNHIYDPFEENKFPNEQNSKLISTDNPEDWILKSFQSLEEELQKDGHSSPYRLVSQAHWKFREECLSKSEKALCIVKIGD